ncbi:hypothetical protein ACQKNX_07620 [Lysinibacillus sp. NPDC093712]|uniref:hypothetical protein n=1 Tax=Lysinibacillus sp. NPDC093712 TaxID=3390579 RepID=UPI003D057182
METGSVYLKSNHHYSFRHNQENPRVVSVVMCTPSSELGERPCFKVEYESDLGIDYIPYESVVCGYWKVIGDSKQ